MRTRRTGHGGRYEIEAPAFEAEAGLLGHLLSYKSNGLTGPLRHGSGGPSGVGTCDSNHRAPPHTVSYLGIQGAMHADNISMS
jgi:hypothetical protein